MKFRTFKYPFALMLVSFSFLQTADAQTPVAEISKLSQEVSVLRKQGPTGLEVFLKSHNNRLNSDSSGAVLPSPALRVALDELCQQRDCYASHLYWYTDIEQAKAAARTSGKPILSLRLLGRLDQDLSCANSRFFRVALYPNAEISKLLQDRFILHWQSVRPVPKVTIDFGDGRKLERTITGNSIHYILDASGLPIDAIPGLYSPKAFLRQLQQAEVAVKNYSKLTPSDRESYLRKYHSDRLNSIQAQWVADLSRLGIQSPPKLVEIPSNPSQPPTAEIASSLAVSKMRVETPMLSALQSSVERNQNALAEITDQEVWNKIAQLYAVDAKLDQNSISLIKAKKSQSANTQEDNLPIIVKKFEATMALDTVRNEYMLHSQIHQWFMQGKQTRNVEALNEQVYAQLFLTPSSDPWLGLFPSDSYSAIDNDGIR
ncbi:thioredoxin domain-containing protein [Nostoc sp.]